MPSSPATVTTRATRATRAKRVVPMASPPMQLDNRTDPSAV